MQIALYTRSPPRRVSARAMPQRVLGREVALLALALDLRLLLLLSACFIELEE